MMNLPVTVTMENEGKSLQDEEKSSGEATFSNTMEERDEVQEVHKASQADTRRVRLSRTVVTLLLLAAACTVVFTTYDILLKEQKSNFEVAFNKFSRTVGDAALLQQHTLRDCFESVTNALTADAIRTNSSWPFHQTPFYEAYAGKALEQSRSELAAQFVVVDDDLRDEWLDFATETYQSWARAGHLQKYGNLDRLNEINYKPYMTKPGDGGFVLDDEWPEYWPMWLYSPPPAQYGAVNWNLITVPDYFNIVQALKALPGESIITKVRRSVSTGTAFTEEEHNRMHSALKTGSSADHPHSFLWSPIYEEIGDPSSKLVGLIATNFAWDFSLRNLMPDNVQGLIAVIANDCNQTYTYEISGADAYYMGEGDLHEERYDEYQVLRELSTLTHPNATVTPGHCQYSMSIYPSSVFEDSYDSNTPEIFAGVISFTFLVVIIAFFAYDVMVQLRNEKLVNRAARSNAVVSSLFPGAMRDKILEQQNLRQNTNKGRKSQMKSFLSSVGADEKVEDMVASKPLADLFLNTSVMFADIVGFTAWSSVREPTQVFTMLETVYGSFDRIAANRRIFKVETVGDCYVAATGVPDARSDHALALVRFASDCIDCMNRLAKKLEVQLGPDTGELAIRIGIHSGSVTAGILRGTRSRFQLFGDTVNTTARMETTGQQGRIHVSQSTADELTKSGKGHWLKKRSDLVVAKGKGAMQTYWVNPKGAEGESQGSFSGVAYEQWAESELGGGADFDDKQERLIDWGVQTLAGLLKQIIARRSVICKVKESGSTAFTKTALMKRGTCPLDEVKEIIALPEFITNVTATEEDPNENTLPDNVEKQLKIYVTRISNMYRTNAFHNFEHASHVCMSVTKLLSRIVAPDDFQDKDEENVAASMHDHTYGITSDPLTQFACAFSALIHDVDHQGIPNPQLIKEDQALAQQYQNRSVAEQNSLDLAWDLLMDDDQFADLRRAICGTSDELERFRALVVNGVMATDIADKELKKLRNARWEKAFANSKDESSSSDNKRASVNRKATIVIEHLIQASDVSHTMQHWKVYRKWNANLFKEMYTAYKEGRAETNPIDFWYKGEIGFFDFYIIPLAKKLADCGVFGVSSDEYLNYALSNRQEWIARGEEVVAEMVMETTEGGAKKESDQNAEALA